MSETYKIVERLKGQKRVTQFNSAGELQVHLCEPSPDDLEAASLIQELAEALEHCTELLCDTWHHNMDEEPEEQMAVIDALAILSKLKEAPHG